VHQRTLSLGLPDEAATRALGTALAASIPPGRRELLFTLAGELGAGKTTLARAVLRAVGVQGTVRSPTYTLVEPYESPAGRLLHLDLYRLSDARDLEDLAYRDLRRGSILALLEWPERAEGQLGPVDLAARIEYEATGRHVEVNAGTQAGEEWLTSFFRNPSYLHDPLEINVMKS
jgi:tRNA threonylcarbamoyladenosine biosynthesis protein TsaE